ncbi:hypothetical protein JCM30237_07450 [Halolamina litorea]|uniref:Uncharacterized protein n=1 Tax=Halolamina litorea TaxID=1515593 RepID=A0ABD6BQS9_9EURY|nr:hypothetical protein [Halolamina litorea]
MTEPYYIHTEDVDRSERSAIVRAFADATLAVTGRTPGSIRLLGITDLLGEYVDGEAVERLRGDDAVKTGDGTIEGRVEATTRTLNDAIKLLSDPLIELHIDDSEGNPIFARDDTHANRIYLDEDEFAELRDLLGSSDLELLERLPADP